MLNYKNFLCSLVQSGVPSLLVGVMLSRPPPCGWCCILHPHLGGAVSLLPFSLFGWLCSFPLLLGGCFSPSPWAGASALHFSFRFICFPIFNFVLFCFSFFCLFYFHLSQCFHFIFIYHFIFLFLFSLSLLFSCFFSFFLFIFPFCLK